MIHEMTQTNRLRSYEKSAIDEDSQWSKITGGQNNRGWVDDSKVKKRTSLNKSTHEGYQSEQINGDMISRSFH